MSKEKDCKNCRHYVSYEDDINSSKTDYFLGLGECRIKQRLVANDTVGTAVSCKIFDIDLSEKKICYNCRFFIGGHDWGLACSKLYHSLPKAISDACKEFERN